jgi:hypothetical protein
MVSPFLPNNFVSGCSYILPNSSQKHELFDFFSTITLSIFEAVQGTAITIYLDQIISSSFSFSLNRLYTSVG